MKIKDVEGWKNAHEANTDPYGHRIMTYSEDWANAMEREMAKGRTIAECAEETSREADTDGITGFMYGAAVAMLSQGWEHGEELRRWHNLKIQIGNEGERANEKGTVLNPAMLIIGDKDGKG